MAQTSNGENRPKTRGTIENEPTAPSPFSIYKDTYFLSGYSNSAFNEDLVIKFQISAKFRMPIRGLYIAYTQRSFMDVLAESEPMTDNNFEPEVYYIHSFSNQFEEKNGLRSLQIGYLHESNGQGGVNSRSWERIYTKAEWRLPKFSFQLTGWYPLFEDYDNRDVEKYYGYGELMLAYIWNNDIRLSGLFHMGTDWPNGNAKMDFTLPFQLFSKSKNPTWKQSNIWFQVFYGYGETFLGYKEISTALAAGVGFRPDFSK